MGDADASDRLNRQRAAAGCGTAPTGEGRVSAIAKAFLAAAPSSFSHQARYLG
jgi:hypothetical protein